jgi:hypothetical protein
MFRVFGTYLWGILCLAWRGSISSALNWAGIIGVGIVGGYLERRGSQMSDPHAWQDVVKWGLIYTAVAWAIIFIVRLIIIAPFQLFKMKKDRADKLEGLLADIFAPESVIARLVELQQDGMKIYNDSDHAPDAYIDNLKRWEAEVEKLLTANFSASELHSFRSRGFYSGSQYMLPNVSKEWLDATEKQRIHSTARIYALNHIIEFCSTNFFGPRLKAAEWLENHHAS